MNKKVYIENVGYYVPERRMANEEFSQFLDTSDEWIYSHTGIRYRHIAAQEDTASTLAYAAAQAVFAKSAYSPDDIDAIIVATSTPDYHSFPATAALVQNKLGIKRAIPAFDISVACSGFIYGLFIAQSMILAGAMRRILLIGSEIFSKILDWDDRSTCVLFGDGAGAAIVAESHMPQSRIIDTILYTAGKDHASLTRSVDTAKEASKQMPLVRMNGRRVYLFAVKSLQEMITTILQRNNLKFDDINWIIPHQANKRIIEAACSRGGFDIKRFYINIAEYANTSAASVPIALAEMSNKQLIQRGDTIITIGFGAGLSYGANLMRW